MLQILLVILELKVVLSLFAQEKYLDLKFAQFLWLVQVLQHLRCAFVQQYQLYYVEVEDASGLSQREL